MSFHVTVQIPGKTIHLLGTLHIPLAPPASYIEAIELSDEVFFEVAPSPEPVRPRELEPLPDDLRERAASGLVAQGFEASLTESRSPLWLAMVLQVGLFMGGEPLDWVLHRWAQGKQAYLETLEGVMTRLDAVPRQTQLEVLIQTLDCLDAVDPAAANLRLREAWHRAEAPSLVPASIRSVLLWDRNLDWLHRILASPHATIGVVVGASHLFGERGLVALLERSARSKTLQPTRACESGRFAPWGNHPR